MVLPTESSATEPPLPNLVDAKPYQMPETYVWIPQRTLDDLRSSPIALGVYSVIARMFLITGEPVPLSAGDLQHYDPTLSYGAARRALERLSTMSYVTSQALPGQKQSYHPTWGLVHDLPVVWDRTARSLGRPRHVRAIRLDDRFLDLCMGRLRPHPIHRAVVERFLVKPLLSLSDLGAYALALVGLSSGTPALRNLGLLDANQCPLPLPDERTVLHIATQRASGSNALTPAGWERLGLMLETPAPTTAQSLFVAPIGVTTRPVADNIGGVIGGVIGEGISGVIGEGVGRVIGGVIGHQTTVTTAPKPFQCEIGCPMTEASGSHGSYGTTELNGSTKNRSTQPEPTEPTEPTRSTGGGNTLTTPQQLGQGSSESTRAQSPEQIGSKSTLPQLSEQDGELQPMARLLEQIRQIGLNRATSAPTSRHTREVSPMARLTRFAQPNGASEPGSETPKDTPSTQLTRTPVPHTELAMSSNRATTSEIPKDTPSTQQVPTPESNPHMQPVTSDKSTTTGETANDSPSARRLRAMGIRADVASSLADRPLTQIEQVIAQAHTRKDIRDRAGWVVATLRMLPADAVRSPQEEAYDDDILFHPTISGYDRQVWLRRFRQADPARRPEILRRFQAAYPPENSDRATTESSL